MAPAIGSLLALPATSGLSWRVAVPAAACVLALLAAGALIRARGLRPGRIVSAQASALCADARVVASLHWRRLGRAAGWMAAAWLGTLWLHYLLFGAIGTREASRWR